MIRSRPLFAIIHRLALVATLLMLVAPLLSRWQQSLPSPVQALCSQTGPHQAMPDPAGRHADRMAAASHDANGMPTHAEHGEACDYCVLAARLLPWLAVALLVLPLLRVSPPEFRVRLFALAALHWPAHAARGPPLRA